MFRKKIIFYSTFSTILLFGCTYTLFSNINLDHNQITNNSNNVINTKLNVNVIESYESGVVQNNRLIFDNFNYQRSDHFYMFCDTYVQGNTDEVPIYAKINNYLKIDKTKCSDLYEKSSKYIYDNWDQYQTKIISSLFNSNPEINNSDFFYDDRMHNNTPVNLKYVKIFKQDITANEEDGTLYFSKIYIDSGFLQNGPLTNKYYYLNSASRFGEQFNCVNVISGFKQIKKTKINDSVQATDPLSSINQSDLLNDNNGARQELKHWIVNNHNKIFINYGDMTLDNIVDLTVSASNIPSNINVSIKINNAIIGASPTNGLIQTGNATFNFVITNLSFTIPTLKQQVIKYSDNLYKKIFNSDNGYLIDWTSDPTNYVSIFKQYFNNHKQEFVNGTYQDFNLVDVRFINQPVNNDKYSRYLSVSYTYVDNSGNIVQQQNNNSILMILKPTPGTDNNGDIDLSGFFDEFQPLLQNWVTINHLVPSDNDVKNLLIKYLTNNNNYLPTTMQKTEWVDSDIVIGINAIDSSNKPEIVIVANKIKILTNNGEIFVPKIVVSLGDINTIAAISIQADSTINFYSSKEIYNDFKKQGLSSPIVMDVVDFIIAKKNNIFADLPLTSIISLVAINLVTNRPGTIEVNVDLSLSYVNGVLEPANESFLITNFSDDNIINQGPNLNQDNNIPWWIWLIVVSSVVLVVVIIILIIKIKKRRNQWTPPPFWK